MAQPDIVIGQSNTTVVKNLRVGTNRSNKPNIELSPGSNATIKLGQAGVSQGDANVELNASDASLTLGDGGGAAQGGISVLGGAGQQEISMSAVDGNSPEASLQLSHSAGPQIDIEISKPGSGSVNDSNQALLDIGNRSSRRNNGIHLFSGRRAGTPIAGIESNWNQNKTPELLFAGAGKTNEVRAYPRVTIGANSETNFYKPGELLVMGGPSERRRVSVRITGGERTNGGLVALRDQNQNETIRMEAKPGGAPGSRIKMQDDSNKTNVELRADEGLVALGSSTQNSRSGGSQGRLTLDDGTGDTLEITAQDGRVIFETDSEGEVFVIETNPPKGKNKKIKTKYKIDQGSL